MKTIKFKKLWKAYPDDLPCSKKDFKNQCAIKVGTALASCGIDTTKLVPKQRHCWHHKTSLGHVLSAEELAAGLSKYKISGIRPVAEYQGHDFKTKLVGKKGIIFFQDYWERSVDSPGSPTGDHIDLWNGSRLTDWRTWMRIQLGLVIPGVWSDLEKATKVLFWQVEEE